MTWNYVNSAIWSAAEPCMGVISAVSLKHSNCPYYILTSIIVSPQSTTPCGPDDQRHASCAEDRRQECPSDHQQRLIARSLATQRQRPWETLLSTRRLRGRTGTLGPRRDGQRRTGDRPGFIGEHQPSRNQCAAWADQGQGGYYRNQHRLAGLQGPGVLSWMIVLIFAGHSIPPFAIKSGTI